MIGKSQEIQSALHILGREFIYHASSIFSDVRSVLTDWGMIIIPIIVAAKQPNSAASRVRQ